MIWPLADHLITRSFAYLSNIYVGGQHAALDLIRQVGPTRASPILAAAAGAVVDVGWDMYSGFFVAIDHADGWRSFYRHMYGQAPVVVGQRVVQGQIIGNVGNTGWSIGDHLHFDLWNRTKQDPTAFWKNGWWAMDPALYLGQEDDTMDVTRMMQVIERKFANHEVRTPEEKAFFAALDTLVRRIGRAEGWGSGSGDGYTDAQAVKAVKDAL